MDESEPKEENAEKERRFDPELLKKGLRCDPDQYKRLLDCSKKGEGGIKEWNEWRKKNPNEEIWLEGTNFSNCYLIGVNLSVDPLNAGRRRIIRPDGAVGSVFDCPVISSVYLKDAVFNGADALGASFSGSHLERANLHANLKGAVIREAYLENAVLRGAVLEGAKLNYAHLRNTDFQDANLKDTIFFHADMRGAKVRTPLTTGTTSFWKIKIDRNTHFLGTAMGSVRIDPATKQLLEYNIRRMNWEDWYKKHPVLKWPVRWFWLMNDYGISTWRIIGTFFVLSLFFASIYANCACWFPQGIVSNLGIEPHLPLWHYFLLLLLRPIYFSVVTMTTLGFGDMYANAQSIWGHILLSLQVILGYVLLGALVTRFAVLFTAGGPAGEFEKDKKKKATKENQT